MKVYGSDIATQAGRESLCYFKLLANESAIAFIPTTTQHRDYKAHGLNYDDDHGGNALAATVSPGRVDFRHHQSFSIERVRQIVEAMRRQPEFGFASDFEVTYHGKTLG